MSWFWSSSGKKDDDKLLNQSSDVYSDLDVDPELKAFARESNTIKSTSTKSQAPVLGDPKSKKEPELKDELSELVHNVKSRKSQVNAAAVFNCALAEYEVNQCFTTGSWWDKSKLCDVQKAAFWKCLEGNKKALYILGYGEAGNTPAQNEKLLETADDLVRVKQADC